MISALLLIDLQIDFLSDTGRLPVGITDADRCIRTANRLISIYEELHRPIIVISNQFKKNDMLGNFFRKFAAVEGSAGADIDTRILLHDAVYFAKSKSSAFTNQELSDYIKKTGIGHVIICGVYAEGCVRATALDALRYGLETTLISDGVASDRKFKYQWALSNMGKKGIRILSLENYLKSDSDIQTEFIC